MSCNPRTLLLSLPWIVLGIFTLCHFLAVPLVVSYDGHLYLDQARMLFTERFPQEWHFLRTPLLQLVTRGAWEFLGQTPEVVLAVTVSWGLAGLVVTYFLCRRFLSPLGAASVVMLVAFNPLVVAYQHTFLTEMGSFFFVAAAALLFLRAYESDWEIWRSISLGLLIGVAYYFRPTLFMLGPIAVVALAVTLLRQQGRFRPLLSRGACLLLLPFLMSLPWRLLGGERHWEDAQVAFALINQAVIPPGDEQLGEAVADYEFAVTTSLREGELTSSGVNDGLIYPLLGILPMEPGEGESFFVETIARYPRRYAVGVARGSLLLLGVPGIDSDNKTFVDLALGSSESAILPGPVATDSWVRNLLAKDNPPGFFRATVPLLVRPFEWLYRSGAFLGLALLMGSWLVGRPRAFIALALPYGFLFYHAATLFSLDRMAVPVVPILSAVPFVVLLWGVEKMAAYKPQRKGELQELVTAGREVTERQLRAG